jgi:hypothetical protein
MKLRTKIFISVAGLFGVLLVLWVWGWVQYFARFPSEHVYVTSTSPDGQKVALFSVKYQTILPWLPSDIEPEFYITIVSSDHARIQLRKTEFHENLRTTFAELAKKHAPWAVTNFAAGEK